MYVLKTKGTAEIPDYIQIRDNDFVLINQFKALNVAEGLSKSGFKINDKSLVEQLMCLPYGQLTKFKNLEVNSTTSS